MEKKVCKNCNLIFKKNPRFSREQWEKSLYCSTECAAEINGKKRIGMKLSEETKKKMSEALKKVVHTPEWNKKVSLANKGKVMSAETRKKISLAHMGHTRGKGRPGNNLGKTFNAVWRENIKEGIKKAYDVRGRKTPESKRIRNSNEYAEWRKTVFSRDKWTCQACFSVGGELHPHHIKQFSKYPDLRFDINNGVTLCAICHRKTDSFGKK